MRKITQDFYKRTDVVKIARELIGKIIVTRFDRVLCAGRIVETEAYIGLTDRASHSYGGKRTARNEHMYADPGTAYVYICYGMHHLFNVVTNKKGIPDAVLIRAVEPLQGVDAMLKRTGKKVLDYTLTKGPGNAAKALGISKDHSGINLVGSGLYLAEDNFEVPHSMIGTSKRIGVEGAGLPAADYPYRFYLKGNRFVSGSPVK